MATGGEVHATNGRPARCPDCGAPLVERPYADICPRCDDVLAPLAERAGRAAPAARFASRPWAGEVRVA